MNMNNAVINGIILGCLLANVQEGFSQFFYTLSTFPQGAVINQGYQYSTPNAFFSRSFFPAPTHFYNQQNNFSPTPAPEKQATTTEFPNIDLRQAAVRTNFVPGPSEYRGFAYHTSYDDGGTSNVFYVTGAESVQLQSLYPTQNARTLASDLTDANNLNSSFEIIRSFIENPGEGIQNFYAKNNQIFNANSPQDSLKYPADTAPLDKPIPLEAIIVKSNNTNTGNGTETTTAATSTNEEEAAESIIIENSRLLPNNETTTTDAPTTTDSETTTLSS